MWNGEETRKKIKYSIILQLEAIHTSYHIAKTAEYIRLL